MKLRGYADMAGQVIWSVIGEYEREQKTVAIDREEFVAIREGTFQFADWVPVEATWDLENQTGTLTLERIDGA